MQAWGVLSKVRMSNDKGSKAQVVIPAEGPLNSLAVYPQTEDHSTPSDADVQRSGWGL
jgi:hypothetical protein